MPFFGVPIRNGLPIGLGSVAGFGVQQFDPSYLFSAGEQGTWYDPSDLTTLFQDSAGTMPVTGVEQVVGLMLDKSKGLVLGPELVTNGDFSSGTTGWTPNGTATPTLAVVSGELQVSIGTATSQIRAVQTLTLVSGKNYKVTGTTRRVVGDNTFFRITPQSDGSSSGQIAVSVNTQTSNTEIQLIFTATAATLYLVLGVGLTSGTANLDGYFDNISVRELPGNHATSTGAARPTLSARYNLLTYSEEFDQGVWVKGSSTGNPPTVTTNTEQAPDGTTTADTYTRKSTTESRLRFTTTQTNSTVFSLNVYAKAGTTPWLRLRNVALFTTGINDTAWFNLSNGTVGTVGGNISQATITAAPNGFYRCTITGTTIASIGALNLIDISSATFDGEISAGTINETIIIWGAQLLTAADAFATGNAYQRIAAATVYDTSNAVWRPYLAFGGTQNMDFDSMLAGTSYFEGANAPFTMFAGASRNTTGAFQTIVGLCNNTDATGANNDQLNFSFRDTTTQIRAITRYFVPPGTFNDKSTDAGTNSAPATAVITWDRTATDGVVRYNTVAGTPADQTQPALGLVLATIGAARRGLTPDIVSYLNGRIYSIIIRGAQSTAAEISATESWVNSRTGAF